MRHGRTESNRRSIYAGRSDEPLSVEGVAEVKEAVPALVPLGLSRVVASPVYRAWQTGAQIASQLGVPRDVDEDLAEMLLGPWTGLTEAQVAERFPAEYELWQGRPSRVLLEGRETLEQVQARALYAAERARHGACPALLVTHVAVVRVLLLHARGAPLDDYKTIDVPNCKVFELSGSADRRADAGRTAGGGTAPGVA
jgi:broad specificity phosphatase PhoE